MFAAFPDVNDFPIESEGRVMAVAMHMEWPGVTAEQYDRVRQRVNWEVEAPEGAILHLASFTPEGARIVDVWESEAAFNRFLRDRLMPVVEEVGLSGEPRVQLYPVHALFTPAFEPKG
jgi:hypothetical protein